MLDASDMPYCENCLRAENEHWIMVLSSESDPDDFDRFCCWECAVSWTAAIVVLTTEDSDPSSQWEREA